MSLPIFASGGAKVTLAASSTGAERMAAAAFADSAASPMIASGSAGRPAPASETISPSRSATSAGVPFSTINPNRTRPLPRLVIMALGNGVS